MFQPLRVLSVLCLALPTARHAAPTAAVLSSLGITGESLAGSLTHDACACDASLGPPPLRKCSRLLSHPRVLLHRVGHYNRIQLPSQSIPHWFQPLPAIGSHRQWGYAIISDWLEEQVSSCELAKLFMAEERSSSFTIGNYHAHSPPPPLHSICGQSVGGLSWEQIKNSQSHSRQELREKWNTHCINDISHCGVLFENS